MPLFHRTRSTTATVTPPAAAPIDALWLDRAGAEGEAANRTTDPDLRSHGLNLIRDGVTIIRGAVSPALCDAVREDYTRYCAENTDAGSHADAHGKHTRLSNFHIVSDHAR